MILKQRKLFWQIFPANLIIILASVVAVGWYSFKAADDFYLDETATDLVDRAHLIQSGVSELVASGDIEKLRKISVESGRTSGTRITGSPLPLK